MKRNELVAQILDLASEQNFRYSILKGGNAVRIYPKSAELAAAVIYFTDHNTAGRANENVLAQCRRLGMVFPIDTIRARARAKHFKETAMNEPQNGKFHNGARVVAVQPQPQSTTTVVAVVRPSPFAVMREKTEAALQALAELTEAINAAEVEHQDVQAMKALMRKFADVE